MAGGFVLLDKPTGMTSRQAGGKIARMFGADPRRAGHLGTLDPMATGLLVIALGEATKMIPYLESGQNIKEYAFSVEWGYETDTLDITGKETKRDNRLPDYKSVDDFCYGYNGEIEQIPPAFSAVHIGGRKAYELARRGEKVEMKPRKVMIYDLVLGGTDSLEKMKGGSFLVKCGPGTYVRSLARDIGALSGGYLGTVSMIRRTKANGFSIKDAVSLDFLENMYNNGGAIGKYLKPLDFGLDDIPVAKLENADVRLFENGGVIITKDESAGLRRVYSDGRFVGIGMNDNYVLLPKRIIKT